MHRKSVILLVIACTLVACNWGARDTEKPAITTDTLKYTYKIIERKSADCSNKKDSGCIVAKIKYPVFIGQKLLNDTISHQLLTQFGIADKPDNSLEQLADDFLKSGRDFRLNTNTEVIRQDSSILVMELSGYRFLGGARGYALTSFINWNTKAGKKIELKDIFIDGYAKNLNSVAERIFRKQEKLSDSAALKPNYLFPEGKFTLNNNFLITPIGIRFLYNQYEIKPYPAGETNILIPYSQIESLLRPNTVVTQYHK
ncbi:DUF3298 domain-containing protein [Mucilaginibacter sp. McL0603]|uniref:DUF3298 and DUF4163 domain-containing protein n=1 Tax=Mucilaginibacter sp. McL0603 TaxID=3415670 RepID=UPI003CF6411D